MEGGAVESSSHPGRPLIRLANARCPRPSAFLFNPLGLTGPPCGIPRTQTSFTSDRGGIFGSGEEVPSTRKRVNGQPSGALREGRVGESVTARSERAVRAGPGGASDRRGVVAFPNPTDVVDSPLMHAPAKGVGQFTDGPAPAASGRLVKATLPPPSGSALLPRSVSRNSAVRTTSGSPLLAAGRLHVRRGSVPLLYTLTTYCGTFDILKLLMREGEATMYAMSRKLPPTPKAIASSIHCLEWLGLVERAATRLYSKPYRLTILGRGLLAKPIDAWPSWLTVSLEGAPP